MDILNKIKYLWHLFKARESFEKTLECRDMEVRGKLLDQVQYHETFINEYRTKTRKMILTEKK